MKVEDIFDEWKKDSYIDKTELGDESLKIPSLHHKYFQIYLGEKSKLRLIEAELKALKLEKYEFYTQGPDEDSKDKGWKLPAKGMILKGDLPMYMEADQDLINLALKIGLQKEKLEVLDSIIKNIMNRSFIIRDAIEWQKFTMGAG